MTRTAGRNDKWLDVSNQGRFGIENLRYHSKSPSPRKEQGHKWDNILCFRYKK
jgi:hypothetical protein